MKIYAILFLVTLISIPYSNASSPFHHSAKELPGIQMPNHPQSILEENTPGCNQFAAQYEKPIDFDSQVSHKVHLLHHHHRDQNRLKSKTTLLLESLARDQSRLHSLHQRKKNSIKATYSSSKRATYSSKNSEVNFSNRDTYSSDLKNSVRATYSSDLKNSEVNFTSTKNQELNLKSAKNPDVNSSDLKNPEVNSFDLKNSEANFTSAKNQEVNSSDLKNPEANCTSENNQELNLKSAKDPDVNSSDLKNPEVNFKSAKNQELNLKSVKNPEVNSSDLRNPEANFTSEKNQELNLTSGKNPEVNSSDLKNQELNLIAGKNPEQNFTAEILVADVESGVSVGSGEYFIDAFIGTPAKHFQLIVDTGSDLNWIQCLPCEACYPQVGPIFNSSLSSSYRPVPCTASECSLVDTGAAGQTCTASAPPPCNYFYWYGDFSNTTGDLATETFTVNVTGGAAKTVNVTDVVFGCGHANRGLFHGAAGLLGLGRGPLSFASQLRRRYGQRFSYCLVDRDSNISVTSKLVFGEDRRLSVHPDFQSTAFLSPSANGGATFYYLNISSVNVGGETVNVPPNVWDGAAAAAGGGFIIDSGTTLTYLAQPAYGAVRAAFEANIPYARGNFSPLELCYNVSGVAEVRLPEFSFRFGDGAVWRFPAENYFIQPDPEESVVCLAVMMTSAGSLSILGNYQQQNFHVMYDVEGSRLGFAPMDCADV